MNKFIRAIPCIMYIAVYNIHTYAKHTLAEIVGAGIIMILLSMAMEPFTRD